MKERRDRCTKNPVRLVFWHRIRAANHRLIAVDQAQGRDRSLERILRVLEFGLMNPATEAQYDAWIMLHDVVFPNQKPEEFEPCPPLSKPPSRP